MYLQVNAYITGIKLHMIMTDREFDQNYHNMHNPLIVNKMSNLLCSMLRCNGETNVID